MSFSIARPAEKHVCAIAKVGRTKWFGYNNAKSHPRARRKFRDGEMGCCPIHAEMDALMKVPRASRERAKLFVFRFLKDGTLSMAKPCEMCQSFLEAEGVKLSNIYFTDWNGEWKNLKSAI